ncbi:ubiquinone biosynthesis protein UbiJ [Ectothiorhodosinus mongolicus]|uniref:Ubiquinone biosynthesis accessory factor UbiJ n=1 Tax=Ectothiorhodosinus mongolicus TaxID=233100 RepID=A0A1R3VZ25_9GAMM|nr:SCP2 sterol-binding domain-containing protein [Ectothiorhodosinus mongolicus]ULX56978.1 sterol-binding protein [Ectothiorhodosinus mongolicus]SIT69275.1 ubiquinone biosynthesis protein UbiJ [Ectothiorhodosinus mongolicus]
MIIPSSITQLIEEAINRFLGLDADSQARIERMQKAVIAVEITGLDLTLFFLPAADSMQVLSHYDGQADARIAATPLALINLATGTSGTQLPEGVVITGDAEVAKQFNDLLRQVDIDWEELLARLTGDIIAHQTGRTLAEIRQWWQRNNQAWQADIAEYLQEESRTLPSPPEVEGFLDAVDALRNDAERLEARLKRLEARGAEKGS